jgi:hypothetical protein
LLQRLRPPDLLPLSLNNALKLHKICQSIRGAGLE